MTEIERQVFELIQPHTKSAPISLSEIKARTNLSQRRALDVIRALRCSGKPIGRRKGNPHGYWFAIDPDDIARASENYWREGISYLTAAARMRNRRDILEKLGQLSLDRNLVVRAQPLTTKSGERLCRQCLINLDEPREGQVFCSGACRAAWSRGSGVSN